MLCELQEAQPYVQKAIRPLPRASVGALGGRWIWAIRDVQRVLTPPLPPPQDPQSMAEEEVWREVRLSDHLPQHGEEQWGAAALTLEGTL